MKAKTDDVRSRVTYDEIGEATIVQNNLMATSNLTDNSPSDDPFTFADDPAEDPADDPTSDPDVPTRDSPPSPKRPDLSSNVSEKQPYKKGTA